MREFCQEAVYRPAMEGAQKSLRKARQDYKKRTKAKKKGFKFCLFKINNYFVFQISLAIGLRLANTHGQ